jgi:hypothetical protein
MDYKKIIKSRETRLRILRTLDFIPDKTMIKMQYFIKTGRRLNLKNPQRYTEKLQWYKLYYRDPLMQQCADKYDVREYVRSKGLGYILNECYGVYERVEDIDFDSLPDQFVLKDTLGGGGNSIIICKDKATFDFENAKKQMQKWLSIDSNKKNEGREWVYQGRKHRIIIEKYIESNPSEGGLVDYKFFCFNGEPKYLYVIADRILGQIAGIGIFNVNFELLSVIRTDERPLERNIEKPKNFDEMIDIVKIISKDFPHVRVDLYNQDGNIIFGENTFFDGSGYHKYEPDEFDYELGSYFKLPFKNNY